MKPMLAETWIGQNPTGWLMQEKLDGFRAIWDGSRLITREGFPVPAPESFVSKIKQSVPRGIIDGELWCGRGNYAHAMSCVKSDKSASWNMASFVPFDSISSDVVEQRILAAGASFSVCKSYAHLCAELRRVFGLGGEGLMLRKPRSLYVHARTENLLKVRCENNMALILAS